MLPKLILIIIVAGATACALLVNRQHRIDTAHEIAVLHQRLLGQEQTLWRMRSDIASRTRPDHIQQSIDALGGSWVAIPAPPDGRHGRLPKSKLAAAERVADRDEEAGG